MMNQSTRRDILRGSLALAGLGVLGIPEWALPALAQGETVVPFTDTRPSSIICSEARREAMPACERIFCKRSISSLVYHEGPNITKCPFVSS